jgi:PAS domain S-box-containing protein
VRGRSSARARTLIAGLAGYVLLGGLVSFLGWAADLPRLADWDKDGIAIQPNATIAAMAAGTALLLSTWEFRRAAALPALLVSFIGGTVLLQYLGNLDLGIDTLFMFGRTWGRVGVLAPGRMGPPGATSWTLLGVGLLLATWEHRPAARRIAPVIGEIGLGVSALSLIGYLYGASGLYAVPTVTVIALQTSTFILATSVGLILSVPEYGPVRFFSQSGPAGTLARRVVPFLVGVPILLGLLRVLGERGGLYDSAFGSALRTVCEIVLFLVLLWRTTAVIARQDALRRKVDAALDASRQRVVATLEQITDGFVLLDAEWRLTYVNAEAERLLGTQRAAVLGKPLWDVFPEDVAGDVHRRLQGAAQARLPVEFESYNPVVRRWFANKAYPLADSSLAVYFQDVTARKETEARLAQSRQEVEAAREEALQRERAARADAERAVQLKEDFLATVSHELRTPLTAILGWSHYLQKDISDLEKTRKAAEIIERNAHLQAQLITDLLDMSGILSGKMRLELQPVALSDAIDSAVEAIQPAAAAKQLQVERHFEPLSGKIQGDPGRIQQIVWNLLSNAVKFTPRGGRIDVALTRRDEHLELRISDTGDGIAPELLPHIFDRFRQADASASRKHGGLGIGLALVKQLVELHGGRVYAASDGRGQGATFVVELPVGVREHEVDAQLAEPPPAGATTHILPARLQGLSILVVDDEPDARSIVGRALEENDAVVTVAASCDEALAILGCRRFDLIISDIGMPGRDGYEMIAQARERGIHTAAVALTAYARAQDREKSLSSGFQAHLAKPIRIGELLATVAAVAHRTQAKHSSH